MGSLAATRRQGGGLGPVPQVRLDTVLPSWASTIHLLKIDTQGYELKILRGAMASLRANRFRHVLYEFSPWLMLRGGLGEPFELLQLMPNMHALCSDVRRAPSPYLSSDGSSLSQYLSPYLSSYGFSQPISQLRWLFSAHISAHISAPMACLSPYLSLYLSWYGFFF